jgi:hypothetical protein
MDSSTIHQTAHTAMSKAQGKFRTLTKVGLLLGIIIATTTIIAPLVYLLGWGYYQGSLQPYGVDSSFFPLATPEYFSLAFITVADGIGYVAKAGNLISVLFLLVATLVAAMQFIGHPSIKWPVRKKELAFVTWLKAQWFAKPLGDAANAWLQTCMWLFGSFLFFLIVVIAPPFVGFAHGHATSKRQIADHKACVYPQASASVGCTFIMQDADHVYAGGLLVARSDQYLALYENGQARLYPAGGRVIVSFAPLTTTGSAAVDTPTPLLTYAAKCAARCWAMR